MCNCHSHPINFYIVIIGNIGMWDNDVDDGRDPYEYKRVQETVVDNTVRWSGGEKEVS